MKFRREPSPNERKAYGLEVVHTLERAGFDRRTTLVMGGGAMAMCGIRRTGDVDTITPYYGSYDQMWREKRTPSGLILQDKWGANRPFLETTPAHLPPDMLGVDITHPHDETHHQPSLELDDEFLQNLKNFDSFEGYRYLPLELVAAHKETDAGVNSRKNRRDIKLIRRHLRQD